MKHIGIVAVSAEGAALCYRTICQEAAATLAPHSHPEISLHNFSLEIYQRLIDLDDWLAVGELLLRSAQKLIQSGADLLVCPDNTVHQGLDLVLDRQRAPWLHIADEVTREAVRRGYKRVGILGTRFLMEGPVYPRRLVAAGIGHQIPSPDQREGINQIIYNELLGGRVLSPSLDYLQEVVRDLASDGCDAIALACTELPMMLDQTRLDLPNLDSTRILARAALRARYNHPVVRPPKRRSDLPPLSRAERMSYRYRVVDVFTIEPLAGNPLAVVPDVTGLDDATMQKIAREFNLSETTFVLPPTRDDCLAHVRIFTPKKEMALSRCSRLSVESIRTLASWMNWGRRIAGGSRRLRSFRGWRWPADASTGRRPIRRGSRWAAA